MSTVGSYYYVHARVARGFIDRAIAMTASTHCFVGLDGSDPMGSLVILRISRWMDSSPRYTTMYGNTEGVA